MRPLLFDVYAGKTALEQIHASKALRPQDITAVFGASGAAKWLSISALDGVIFGDWLRTTDHPIHLFGTSVGAWKLAAAAQLNPKQALADFADAYCEQRYGASVSHADIQAQTDLIINKVFTPERIDEILNHPRFRFHCGAVRCRGWMQSEAKPVLAAGMALCYYGNLLGRQQLRQCYHRVVFHDVRQQPPLEITDGIPTSSVPLARENFIAAISASGSIPYVMAGVGEVPGTSPGMYRDGGLLDYHPLPANLWKSEGMILYPHFYPHIIPSWFDKSLPWRRATAEQLANVVLLCPSAEFVRRLPDRKIPSRKDFVRFKGDNETRIQRWQQCLALSRQMAGEFLDCVNSSKLPRYVHPL